MGDNQSLGEGQTGATRLSGSPIYLSWPTLCKVVRRGEPLGGCGFGVAQLENRCCPGPPGGCVQRNDLQRKPGPRQAVRKLKIESAY